MREGLLDFMLNRCSVLVLPIDASVRSKVEMLSLRLDPVEAPLAYCTTCQKRFKDCCCSFVHQVEYLVELRKSEAKKLAPSRWMQVCAAST